MGCTPSVAPPTAVAPAEQNETNSNMIFTVDERLKLKEVWVIVKQNNLKKLGDDIMTKALGKNATLINYWQNAAFFSQNNLTFNENESFVNTDALSKQSFKQHGYKILEKIDQLIMIMVTRVTATNSSDIILKDYFQKVANTHAEYKIKQDHVDMLCESIIECFKALMYQHGNEWTIKHESTWGKLLGLITNQFLLSPTTNSTTNSTTKNVS